MNPVVPLAQQLIQLPSVSPMGLPLPAESDVLGEERVGGFLKQWGAEGRAQVVCQTVEPRRDNVVFLLPGDRPGVLLWEVHQDTVPVDGMTIDPFSGDLSDGRIYGRGACDVKGSMACMLSALRTLESEPASRRPTLVLACTVDEELGGSGARVLPQLWEGPSPSLPRPDVAVVAEPTGLDVVVAHKGVVRWRCRTAGRAVHSSNPDLGDNAIYRMGAVVQQLDRYHREVLRRQAPHPLLGTPTISVGKIAGGSSINIVADHCVVEIDRRVLPGETPQSVQDGVREFLAAQGVGELVEHEPPFLTSIALSDKDNGELAERVSAAARQAGAGGRRIGVNFGTNAARLSPHVRCVVFGAGSIDQAHTDDEWVAVDQLLGAAETLRRLALDW